MTVEEIRGEIENYDKFPVGLRVLAVDDDPTCLKLLETLLRKCQYHVTTTGQARTALNMLRENRDSFDLVITDVHMPDMDGFKLLEIVGLEMDLPVIMLSANSDPKLVMKGVNHGACDYLVKPIRIEELRNIWQHVIRKKKFDPRSQKSGDHHDQASAHQESGGDGHESPTTGTNESNGRYNRKRKDEEEGSEDNGNDSEDPATQKKPRIVWSIELHRKFVAAVNQLGIEKAVPKRILDMMGVNGLTRENVASHLQKYRLYLKRISSVAAQQANMAAVLGVKDSPFMRMTSLDNIGDYRSMSAPGRLGTVSVSPFAANNILRRLNSPAAMNLRNLTPNGLIQPSNNQVQTLSSSIPSLGKIHLTGQNPNLYQGMPPSVLGVDHNNKAGVSISSTFGDVGGSGNLLNGNSNNQIASSCGGFTNQPCHNIVSFSSDPPFNISGSSILMDPAKCSETWQGNTESSKGQPNSFHGSEQFQSEFSINCSIAINNSFNGPYLRNNNSNGNNAIELSSGMPIVDSREMQHSDNLVGNMHGMNQESCQRWGEQRPSYAHGLNDAFGGPSSNIPSNSNMTPLSQSMDQNSGIFNQNMDMFVTGRSNANASTLMQENENEKLGTDSSRVRSNEDFLFEQQKLQGGFATQAYDSLDEMVNAMIKREREETIPNCDFGFDDYSFGSGI